MLRKPTLSTEVFAGKPIPDFVQKHKLFNTPVAIKKVFPKIGLPNFADDVNIAKCIGDIRKEGSFVYNLLKTMHTMLIQSKSKLELKADALQWVGTAETRAANRRKITEAYNLGTVIDMVCAYLNPQDKDVLANAIQLKEGRVSLYLTKDVPDPADPGKILYRCGEALLRVFGKVKTKLIDFSIDPGDLEQSEAFQIFSRENVPNRPYKLVFSSEGPDGAWDLLTMSMRGIKSCQRWDGEYPRCTIGSILSRFVGIMYLTSGAEADRNPAYGTALRFNDSIGTKMMRRAIVRYVIDADEESPCILLDKMYQDADKDILELFLSALKRRTSLPVYYAPDLVNSNKLKSLYMPKENIRRDILDREWSYQDTPLQSTDEMNICYLNILKEEVERETFAFRTNLELYMAEQMEAVYAGTVSVDAEIKKTIRNIRMHTSFIGLGQCLVQIILAAFLQPSSEECFSHKAYYQKYLRTLLLERHNIAMITEPNISFQITQSASRLCDVKLFTGYIFTLLTSFIKSELKTLVC